MHGAYIASTLQWTCSIHQHEPPQHRPRLKMDASRQLAASTRTFHSPSDLTAGDLLVWDAPTHPLFERSRWPLDIDYDRVKPSCQFASAANHRSRRILPHSVQRHLHHGGSRER